MEEEAKKDTENALDMLRGCVSALTALSAGIIYSIPDVQKKLVLEQIEEFMEIYKSKDNKLEEQFREGALKVLNPVYNMLTEAKEESSKG